MKQISKASLSLSIAAVALASCATADSGETDTGSDDGAADAPVDYTVTEMGTFNEPWAIELAPGTQMLFVTEKSGTMKFIDTAASGGAASIGTVSGVPTVDYGGQGGLGDVAFLDSEADDTIDGRTIYLSWAEAGDGDTRGAAVGKGTLTCGAADSCRIDDLAVIWRQSEKVSGRGHYSHRISISPDGQYLFIASGDRQKKDPAQDTSNNLGSIVRLNLDGTPASGNPMESEGGATAEIWSYGHRNILGMDWDDQGRLWEVEHGPAGGDELNLVKRNGNYGWPARSNGDNYDGSTIIDHAPDDGFDKPALSWTPVIAPGDMIIYTGDMFAPWKGDALMAGLKTQALIRVALNSQTATEEARYDFGKRLRSIEQAPDGSIFIAEDGQGGRVLRLSM